jgi:hypothetical protein
MNSSPEYRAEKMPTGAPDENGDREALPVDEWVDEPADLGVSERALVRKLDLYLIPLIMGLYLFSFIDRSVSPISQAAEPSLTGVLVG